ncbi:MAG: M20/M25/M40 family metallo-hydrolase [Oscillospiraceae bacterium]|nr:M20/M25/M40 family metallo-hydrolase [Oscillospiraceae bacterium]
MEIKSVLKTLTESTGVSGDEFSVSEKAADFLREYADNVSVDAFGSVLGFVKAEDPNAKTLLLDAHIDQVGLIVTFIDENGFIGVGACGSPDLKTLLAQSVTIHGKKEVLGVVSTLPPHVSKASKEKSAPEIGDIFIDIGLSKEEAEKVISLGDRITINSSFRELSETKISAPAIDNRSGVCAVLHALEMLKGKKTAYNIAVCFSCREETGESGAKMNGFKIQPDEALVVDVSFGNTPDSSEKDTAKLGSGVMIGFSAGLDKEMSNKLCALAKNANIPFTREIMPSSTGTNADVIGISGRGVKCCTLSLPIRYMHTAVETADLRDIEAVATLICEYAEEK